MDDSWRLAYTSCDADTRVARIHTHADCVVWSTKVCSQHERDVSVRRACVCVARI